LKNILKFNLFINLPLADNGVVVPGKVTRVFGTHYFDHFLDPITIPTFETSQSQNHVLAWTIKTEKN
jgi:hypothetical protein